MSVKLKSRRNLESLYFRGKHLLLGKVKRGKRRIHREQSSNQRRWRSWRRPGEGIGDVIGLPSSVVNGEMEFGNEGQLTLLAARLRD